MQRCSRYRDYKIQVTVSDTNTVHVRVFAPQSDGDRLLYQLEVKTDAPRPRPEGLIRQAWTIGKEFVDTRLELEETLRHVPDWELR